jgi:hypothetical protein
LISFGNASFAGSTSVVTVALTSAAISGALNRLTGEAGAAAAAVVVVVVVVEGAGVVAVLARVMAILLVA